MHKLRLFGYVFIIVAIAGCLLGLKALNNKESRMANQATNFSLSSPVFAANATIPAKYTCKGENISPPLMVSGIPDKTASMVLLLHDPDAPSGDYSHWVVWNIPVDTVSIDENSLPQHATEGLNGANQAHYMGPCPPSGTHHYLFDLYALDSSINLPAGSRRPDVLDAMKNHIVAQTQLVGLFSAD